MCREMIAKLMEWQKDKSSQDQGMGIKTTLKKWTAFEETLHARSMWSTPKEND